MTPSSIVYLLVKLRLKSRSSGEDDIVNTENAQSAEDDEIDEAFLHSRRDAEETQMGNTEWAHAPYWPGVRFEYWSIVCILTFRLSASKTWMVASSCRPQIQ